MTVFWICISQLASVAVTAVGAAYLQCEASARAEDAGASPGPAATAGRVATCLAARS